MAIVMRILRDYGMGVGAVLLVMGYILSTLVPERLPFTLTLGLFGLLLLAAGVVADHRRAVEFLKGRRGRAAGASLGYSLVVVAVVVLVNFLAGRHHIRIDLTENKLFSLSEQTVKVLEMLPREVSMTVFYRESEPDRQRVEDLLAEYRYRTERLDVRFIDPDLNPGEVKRYEIDQDGTIVVESGVQETRLTAFDEESLTNALIKVTRDIQRSVYFVTGHGERDLADEGRDGLALLREELEKQHYDVKPLTLTQGVPDDSSVLVIAGPVKKFLDTEIGMVIDYIGRGGRLLLLDDPGTDPGLDAIPAHFGAAVRDDVVIDKISQLFGGDARIPLVPADGYDEFHEITRNFRYQTFYPMASSIEIKDDLPEGVTATRLARTSEYSWGETDEEEFKSGRMTLDEEADTPGPITVAAALVRKATPAVADDTAMDTDENEGAGEPDDATKPPEGDAPAPLESRLLLFGDSDFLSNSYFNASGNGDLALNGIAWLAEQGELVSIRPKTSVPSLVVLTSQQMFFYFWTIVAFAPLTITVVGVGIWVRRKRL